MASKPATKRKSDAKPEHSDETHDSDSSDANSKKAGPKNKRRKKVKTNSGNEATDNEEPAIYSVQIETFTKICALKKFVGNNTIYERILDDVKAMSQMMVEYSLYVNFVFV